MASTTNMRINSVIHQKITDIAKKDNVGIQRAAEKLLEFAITEYYSKELIETTELERTLNNRMVKIEEQLSKTTERLAGLMARIGIDNSMSLMGVIVLLEKLIKEDPKEIQAELRKRGAIYFTSAIKEDKQKKKESRK